MRNLMKITLSSLKRFIDFDLTAEEVADRLTELGIEVDGIQFAKPPFSGIVVAEVLKAEQHPDADRLKVTEVSDGKETFQVVCGAKNCEKGKRYPFAKIGAVLDLQSDDPFKIKKAKLRGVESQGMLCAADELGFGGSAEGILELPPTFPLGQDLLELLWDPVLELSLTPNLGHCMSVLGIARELSALLRIPLKTPLPPQVSGSAKPLVTTKIEAPELCSRYCIRAVENISIKPSPFWLQHQLLLAGFSPINNIVDITNWVMLEMGQPMHAFDLEKLDGKKLVVKRSEKQQSFESLDQQKRTIYPETLVIADSKKPVAIAGVIGGENSSISPKTTAIALEAAYFDPQAVRSAMKDLSLRTESGIRFEKGTDMNAPAEAIERAIELLQESCEDCKVSALADEYPSPFSSPTIKCRTSRVELILGKKFSLSEIQMILADLGFIVRAEKDHLNVKYPAYRHDINAEIDLISEVSRVYGYNNFEKKYPAYSSSTVSHAPMYLFEKDMRRVLVQQGLQECITCDLISPRLATLTLESSFPPECLIQTLHSKTEEHSILRPSLLPGLLDVLKHNQDHKNFDFYGFEIGNVHFKEGENFLQQTMGALLLSGLSMPSHWDLKGKSIDFFDLKGIIEDSLESLNIHGARFTPSTHPSLHPTQQATLVMDEEEIGVLGQVHPDILEELSIRGEAFFSEFNLQTLQKIQNKKQRLQKLSVYPSSERDWTLTLSHEVPIADVYDAIKKAQCTKLEQVQLIDLYTSDELGDDKKNVTFRFSYRDSSKTISMEEVEEEHKKIIEITTDLLQDYIIS